MKIGLLKDYNKDNVIYQSYIKTLYEGVKKIFKNNKIV